MAIRVASGLRAAPACSREPRTGARIPIPIRTAAGSSLLLPRLQQADHLGDPCPACLRAPGALDPPDEVVPVKRRHRFEEEPGIRFSTEGGANIRGNSIRLMPVRSQNNLDVAAEI